MASSSSLVQKTKDFFRRGKKSSSPTNNNHKNNDGTASPTNHSSNSTATATLPDITAATATTTNGYAEDVIVEPIIIVGAGIVGLVLSLYLHKLGMKPVVYEQAPTFHDDVGAGMGMYPNGLRVIRDISPQLLQDIIQAGKPYGIRKWEKHDGTQVAVAKESVLVQTESPSFNESDEEDKEPELDLELQPIGIRRWRLQKLLWKAVQEVGITIHFNKQLKSIHPHDDTTVVVLTFQDGTMARGQLVLAADGSKSLVRNAVVSCMYDTTNEITTTSTSTSTTTNPNDTISTEANTRIKPTLVYTGVTCLMGTSTIPQADNDRSEENYQDGIALTSSETTKCHGAFYPVSSTELCFQFHFPTPPEQAQGAMVGSWGTLTEHVGQEECQVLLEKLQHDGWSQKYLNALQHVDKAIKIGFSTLEPALPSFAYGRMVLIGDAAHPPVPYIGQGAQQGLEDAGTLALLLKHICFDNNDTNNDKNENKTIPKLATWTWDEAKLQDALKLYNQLRVPRTNEILEHGKLEGMMQQKRAENPKYGKVRDEKIRREVFYHETLPHLLPGTTHDYKETVMEALKEYQHQLLNAAAQTPPLVPIPEGRQSSFDSCG